MQNKQMLPWWVLYGTDLECHSTERVHDWRRRFLKRVPPAGRSKATRWKRRRASESALQSSAVYRHNLEVVNSCRRTTFALSLTTENSLLSALCTVLRYRSLVVVPQINRSVQVFSRVSRRHIWRHQSSSLFALIDWALIWYREIKLGR